MKQALVQISLVVRDYDEAIGFYTQTLGFELLEDTPLNDEGKRWVVVSPKKHDDGAIRGATIILAKASNDQQIQAIGNQAGGRVLLFLATDDCQRDYQAYKDKGVKFVREPAQTPYAKVAVFEDLYGNRWDLLQHTNGHRFAL